MSLGRLIATLGMDTADWVKGLTKAEYQMQQFEKSVERGMDKVATKMAGAVVAFLAVSKALDAISKTADFAGKLDDMAEAAGASVEEMDRMALSLKLVGVEGEGAVKMITTFSKQIVEASNPASDAAKKFEAMGVSLQRNADGTVNSAATMNKFIEQLARIPDAALRTAIAMDTFGKAGKEIAQNAKDYAAATALTAQHLEKWGPMNEEATKAGERFGQELTLMGDGMMRMLTPAMKVASEGLTSLRGAFDFAGPSMSEFAKGITTFIVESIKWAIITVTGAVNAFKIFGAAIGAVVATIDAVLSGGSVKEVWSAFGDEAEKIAKSQSGMTKELWGATTAIAAQAPVANKTQAELEALWKQYNKGGKAAADAAKELAKLTEKFAIMAEAESSGVTEKTVVAIRELDRVYRGTNMTSDEYLKRRTAILNEDAKWVKTLTDMQKAQEAARKEGLKLVEASDRLFDSTAKNIEKLDESNEKLAGEVLMLGKSTLERKLYNIELERTNALKGVEDEQQKIDINQKFDQTRALTLQLAAGERYQEQLKSQGELYKQIADYGGEMFEAMAGGMKSLSDWAKKAGEDLKKYLLNALYEATFKKWTVQMLASVSGGGGAAGGAGGGGGSWDPSSMMQMGGGGMGGMVTSAGTAAATYFGGEAAGLAFGAAAGSSFTAAAATLGIAAEAGAAAVGGMAAVAGAMVAMVPVIGAFVAAAYVAYTLLSQPEGGPKSGGMATTGGTGDFGGRFFTPSEADTMLQPVVDGMAEGYEKQVKAFGGMVDKVNFAIGYDTDPQGTADNRVSAGVSVGGRTVYDVRDKTVLDKEGTGSRNQEDLTKELGVQAKRMLFAALQASDLPKDIATILNAVPVEQATEAVIDKLMLLAGSVKMVDDALASLDDIDATIAKLGDGTITGSLEMQGEALTEMALNMGSSTEAIQAVANASGQYYNTLIELEVALRNVSAAITNMFAETADMIISTGKDAAWMIDHLNEDAEASYAALLEASDPAIIESAAKRINDDINKAWNLLTPEEQENQRDYYLESLQKVNDTVNAKLKEVGDASVEKFKETMAPVKDALMGAADKMNTAADKQVVAADTPVRVEVEFTNGNEFATVNG